MTIRDFTEYHANELQHALDHAASTLPEPLPFITIGAHGMRHINVPVSVVRHVQAIASRVTRQAIRTRYRGATDTKGSRIIAAYAGGRLSVPYAHELNSEENHRAAAQALADKLKWGDVVSGAAFANDYYWTTA